MKTSKKILLGLLSALLVVPSIGFLFTKQVLAVDENTFEGATYTLIGLDTIQIQLRGAGSEPGQTYTFYDRDTSDNGNDGDANYVLFGPLSDGLFCGSITLRGGWPPADGATSIRGELSGALFQSTDVGDCIRPEMDELVDTFNDEAIDVEIPEEGPVGGTCTPGMPGCECDSEGNCVQGAVDDISGCVDAASYALAWLVCPVLAGIGDTVEGLNDIIEGLLVFNVEDTLPDTGEVRQVWSAFRALATSVLVIVMLVMIISQAMGRGPFA